LADVLATLLLTDEAPGSVTLVGIVPADLELGIELSPAVAAVVGPAVECLATELRGLGCRLEPKRLAAVAAV
jgi:hydrogenase maturation protease